MMNEVMRESLAWLEEQLKIAITLPADKQEISVWMRCYENALSLQDAAHPGEANSVRMTTDRTANPVAEEEFTAKYLDDPGDEMDSTPYLAGMEDTEDDDAVAEEAMIAAAVRRPRLFRSEDLPFVLEKKHHRWFVEFSAMGHDRLCADVLKHLLPQSGWFPESFMFTVWARNFPGKIVLLHHDEPLVRFCEQNNEPVQLCEKNWEAFVQLSEEATVFIGLPSPLLHGQAWHFQSLTKTRLLTDKDEVEVVLLSRPVMVRDWLKWKQSASILLIPEQPDFDRGLVNDWQKMPQALEVFVLEKATALLRWLHDLPWYTTKKYGVSSVTTRPPSASSPLVLEKDWYAQMMKWMADSNRQWTQCDAIMSEVVTDFCSNWYTYCDSSLEEAWAALLSVGHWYTATCRPRVRLLTERLPLQPNIEEQNHALEAVKEILDGIYAILPA